MVTDVAGRQLHLNFHSLTTLARAGKIRQMTATETATTATTTTTARAATAQRTTFRGHTRVGSQFGFRSSEFAKRTSDSSVATPLGAGRPFSWKPEIQLSARPTFIGGKSLAVAQTTLALRRFGASAFGCQSAFRTSKFTARESGFLGVQESAPLEATRERSLCQANALLLGANYYSPIKELFY